MSLLHEGQELLIFDRFNANPGPCPFTSNVTRSLHEPTVKLLGCDFVVRLVRWDENVFKPLQLESVVRSICYG